MTSRCPEHSLLVEYAAGTLAPAPCISVTAHLQFCEICSQKVESLKALGGNLLEATEAEITTEDLLDRVFDAIDNPLETEPAPRVAPVSDDPSAKDLPEFVRGLLPSDGLAWRKLSAGLKVASVPVGETQYELALHKIDAGGRAPEHDHNGTEITVVLKGSFSDEDGIYQPGDFIVREPGDRHVPIAAQNDECICLSVLEAPIKLTGFKRVLNPFLQFSPS